MAFLDISPANKGHTLIIPKQHHVSFTELPDNLGKEFGEITLKLSKAVEKAANADGFNLLLNNGTAAGQEVMHTHLHIMPRFNDDDFQFKWTHKQYVEDEMQKFANNIKEHL
jgi:histidine triad (HIT) family protein